MTDETEIPTEGKPDRRAMLLEQLTASEEGGETDAPLDGSQGESAGAEEAGKGLADPAAEAPAWTKPPSSWKKDYHEAWASADPKLQEYAWQREEEMRAGVEPLRAKAEFADAIEKVAAPYIPTIKAIGLDVPTAVQALMQADYTLRNSPPDQKMAYLRQLAAGYGITLPAGEAGEAPVVPPELAAIQTELRQVKGELTTWQQQQKAAQDQQLLDEINKFAGTVEHFEQAKPLMIDLLNKGVAKDLADAYEKAIRLDDDLSAKVQAGRQAKLDVDDRMAKARAAKEAKAAAVSVRGSTPGTQPAPNAQDRRALLEDQFNGLSERL